MPYELDANGVRVIGYNVPIRFYDDGRNLQAEIFLERDNTLNVGGLVGDAGGSTPAGTVTVHGLQDTAIHTGQLDDSQAPQFLKRDGSRVMTGDLDAGGHDIDNAGDLNGAARTLQITVSGTAPATPYAGQLWLKEE